MKREKEEDSGAFEAWSISRDRERSEAKRVNAVGRRTERKRKRKTRPLSSSPLCPPRFITIDRKKLSPEKSLHASF